MFNPTKKVVISAVTVGCLLGGSILFNAPAANAAAIQGPAQPMMSNYSSGMGNQWNMWFQIGGPNHGTNQWGPNQQPNQGRVNQQHNQWQPNQGQDNQQPNQGQFNQQQIPFNIVSEIASILGIEEQTLFDDLRDGNTIVEIAESYDVTESELLEELGDIIAERLDAAVTAGKITETQAEEMETQLTEQLTQFVESTFINSESGVLSAPTDLSATAESSSEISLDWDSVSDATSYYIYRATSASGTYTRLDTVTTSSYTDTDLADDTTYYYKVKAVNSSGTSAYSAKAYATTEED